MKLLRLDIQRFADDHVVSVDFNVDISKAKAEIKRLTNELKSNQYAWEQYAASAIDWEKTSDGIAKRTESLTERQELQKQLVEQLAKKYQLWKDKIGESSGAVAGHKAEWDKANSTYAKTQAEIDKLTDKIITFNGKQGTMDELIKELDDDIKLVNSEFKNSTAGMGKWEDSTEGLNAKLKQLNDTSNIQKQKVELLESQYNKLVEAKQENSTEAKKLLTSLNNEKAALTNTKTELEKYSTELYQNKAKAGDLATQIEKLEKKYKDLSKEQGTSKDELKELKSEIENAKNEHKKLTDAIDEEENANEDLNTSMDKVNDGFSVLKGAISNIISDGFQKLISITKEAATEMVNAGISFESAFAGVKKTVDATDEEFATLKQDIIDMSSEVASSADDIAAVMEMAGQLGISNDALTEFTKTMIMLGDSTNMGAGEAAETLAKFANVTGMSQKDFEKLGSSIVDLGNNYATTESEIMTMALRLAGTGTMVGMSSADILGLSTALSSVGVEAEMGGTALSKAMSKAYNAINLGGTKLNTILDKTGISLHDLTIMQKNNSTEFKKLATSLDMTSTELGNLVNAGNDLENFSEISGMTAEEFSKSWGQDAVGTLTKFIQGLGDTSDASENAVTMLSEMGITEVRLRDSLIRAANASDLFDESIKTANKGWEENTALVEEANRRYETVESQMQMTKNELTGIGIAIYDKFREPLVNALSTVRDKIKEFGKTLQSKEMTKAIETIAKAVGEFVKKAVELAGKVIPKLIKGLASLIKAFDKYKGLIITATTAIIAYTVAYKAAISKTGAFKTAMLLLAAATGKSITATEAQTIAQLKANAAMLANPYVLAAAGLAALTAGIIYYVKKTSEAKATETDLSKEIKESSKQYEINRDKVNELKEARKELDETAKKSIEDGLYETSHIETLRGELDELVDSNGKVKTGYEDRVRFILNELNNALGTEMTLQDGIIKNYDEQMDKIDELIEKQKAEIIFNANKESYEEAIKNQTEYANAVTKAQNDIEDSSKKLKSAQQEEKTTYEALQKALKDLGYEHKDVADVMKHVKIDSDGKIKWDSWIVGTAVFKNLKEEIEDYVGAQTDVKNATKELKDNQKSLVDANNLLKDSFVTIAEYESMSADILAGNYDKVIERANVTVKATAESNSKQLQDTAQTQINMLKILDEAIAEAEKKKDADALKNLKRQKENNQKQLEETMKFLQEQTSTVKNTEPEVKQAWADLANNSTTEFLRYLAGVKPEEAKIIMEMAGIVDENGHFVTEKWASLASDSLSEVLGKKIEFVDAGDGLVQAIIDGEKVGEPQAIEEMATFTQNLISQVNNGETSAEAAGNKLGQKVATGVSNKKSEAQAAGENLIDGVNTGVSSQKKQSGVLSAIASFAGKIVTKLKEAWNEHSPSKVSQGLAEYFMEGIGVGFDKKQDGLVNKIGNYGEELTDTLQSKLGEASLSVNASANLGSNKAKINGIIDNSSSSSGKTVIINQTNNSPQALSRLDIYRQTKNAATLASRM